MLKKYYFVLVVFICLYSSASTADNKPHLALAKHYTQNIDASQYYASEKLDGVRGYWDGQQLYSRNGNVITTPKWFTKSWPKQALDGELWLGRGRFEETASAVLKNKPVDKEWRQLRFMVFDLHDMNQTFEQRVLRLERLLNASVSPYIKPIPQRIVTDDQALHRWLEQVVEGGGEGLMLHRINARYTAGRTNDLLKLKPYWDAEAKVIAHIAGKGKLKGKMGALKVKGLSDQKIKDITFKIGTGFSAAERDRPPVIGSVITYRYQGYTANGIPRFATYLRQRKEN